MQRRVRPLWHHRGSANCKHEVSCSVEPDPSGFSKPSLLSRFPMDELVVLVVLNLCGTLRRDSRFLSHVSGLPFTSGGSCRKRRHQCALPSFECDAACPALLASCLGGVAWAFLLADIWFSCRFLPPIPSQVLPILNIWLHLTPSTATSPRVYT